MMISQVLQGARKIRDEFVGIGDLSPDRLLTASAVERRMNRWFERAPFQGVGGSTRDEKRARLSPLSLVPVAAQARPPDQL